MMMVSHPSVLFILADFVESDDQFNGMTQDENDDDGDEHGSDCPIPFSSRWKTGILTSAIC